MVGARMCVCVCVFGRRGGAHVDRISVEDAVDQVLSRLNIHQLDETVGCRPLPNELSVAPPAF